MLCYVSFIWLTDKLIARKSTDVVVQIKVVTQRLVLWIIEFSLLKFAKRIRVLSWKI